jgi:hypothetical protein
MSFTIVSDGRIEDFKGNPFETETPFGLGVTVGKGGSGARLLVRLDRQQ